MNETRTESAPLMDIAQAANTVKTIQQEIAKVVIGQQQVVRETLIALLAGGHVLLEGVPGLGKTLLVRSLAKTFAGQFTRIQFTPDLMPADVTGHIMFDLKNQHFNVRKGPVFTNLLLADEINRAPAKTQSALLEVMQEQQVTIEGQSLAVPLPFMTLATQNPLEQEGTYPLPEAQLDRFMLKVYIDYPQQDEEEQMVTIVTTGHTGDGFHLHDISPLSNPQTILALQKLTANIQVDPQVNHYAVNIVRTTRHWQGISVGAGPRGGIALIRASRAVALMAGRDFVTPDDIKNVASATLRHRIVLSPEMELAGHTVDDLLQALLDKIEVPRQ